MKSRPFCSVAGEILGNSFYEVVENGEMLLAARRFHHDCYLRAPRITSFTEPLPGGVIDDDYVDCSDYLCAYTVDGNGRPAIPFEMQAVLRMIPKTAQGFPALNHYRLFDDFTVELGSIDQTRMLELSSFAARGIDVSRGLFRLAWRYSRARGDTHWLACLHERTARYFSERFHFEFRQVGFPGDYMGVTAPYVLDLELQYSFLKQANQREWQFYTEERVGCSAPNPRIHSDKPRQ